MTKLSSYNSIINIFSSKTNNEDIITWNGNIIGYEDFIFTNGKEKKVLKFLNDHIFVINNLKSFFNSNYLSYIKEDFIVFNISPNQLLLLDFNKNYSFNYLVKYECEINKFFIKSDLKRKYNHAFKSLTLKSSCFCKNQLKEALLLYKKMDYYTSPKILSNEKFLNFFVSSNNAIVIGAYFNNKPVGIILGFLFKESSYMLSHFYDRTFSKFYVSDFLYQEFIKISRKKGVNKIIWGEVNNSDDGLKNFKVKYSTKIYKSYYIFNSNWIT